MTPAAELWAAVVKHCATGRGYRIEVGPDANLYLWSHGRGASRVMRICGGWVSVRGISRTAHDTADEAVRAALRIVAPSTEPDVSC